MSTLVLFRAVFKRTFIEMKRYAFNTVSGLVTLFFVFLLLFYGARTLVGGGPSGGGTLNSIIVGYWLWILAIFAYGATAQDMTEEAQVGTLEQLAMSPLGLTRVSLTTFLGGIVLQVAILLGMLVLMMAATGRWLNLDLVSILPLLLVTMAGVQGVGMIAGGFAIVYKRIQNSMQILQFVFVAVIAAPLDRFPAAKYVPLSWGRHLLEKVMKGEASLFQLAPGDLALLVAVSLSWLALGIAGFKLLERKARSRGNLAHY